VLPVEEIELPSLVPEDEAVGVDDDGQLLRRLQRPSYWRSIDQEEPRRLLRDEELSRVMPDLEGPRRGGKELEQAQHRVVGIP
jgi:hypothetical protein